MTAAVRVTVPATSANLGPGFDALGLALTWYDEVTARALEPGRLRVDVEGEGEAAVPRDEHHLVVRAALATFAVLGDPPPGLHVTCTNRIPHGRGLGSSAAAIVAGVLTARALVDDGADRLPEEAVLELAASLEGHPDNVAACLLGGLTVAWAEPGRGARAVRVPVSDVLRPVALVPPDESSTEVARRLLPDSVPHADAARNAGRAALLVAALQERPDLLLAATEDRLHQPFRAPAMPETAALVDALRSAGVPAVISGAGPTVLALTTERSRPDAQALAPDGWRVLALDVDRDGARSEVLPEAG